MASTVTLQGLGTGQPGAGAKRPVFGLGGRTIGQGVFVLSYTGNYAVGGESLAELDKYFAEVLSVQVLQNEVTAADRREFTWDKANKKLLMFDAFNVEETATDQQAVADVRLLVTGFLK